jgi:MFS family permease
MNGSAQAQSPWQRAADVLALRRNTMLLLAGMVLAGTGERLWLGFAPKYLTFLGGGVMAIGLFDALQTLLGALYNYPGGWLTDHWGHRRSLLLFSAVSITGYALVLVWHHWMALLFGAVLFVAWGSMSLPATLSVVATSLDRDRHTMGMGVQGLVRRVPMLVGPLIGGWLITRFGWSDGVRYAIIGCIALSGATMVLQWLMKDSTDVEANRAPDGLSFAQVARSFTPALRELLVSDILIRFCERIPYAFVIIWAMDHGGVSAQQFGVLVSVEMMTAMVCYVPVAHLADKHGRTPFVLATFVFFTLFPLSLMWALNFGWLAAAFAVRGLKEFGEPARKALIIGEARPGLRARTYGAYYLIRDCAVTAGSFLGAGLWSLGPRVNFAAAAICGAAGTWWFWWFVYRGKRTAGS